MERIVLTPAIDGKKLAEIDMGKGELSIDYKEEVAFYTSGHILIDGKAGYDYNFRISRKLRSGEKEEL